jgi:hypothetical protein
MTTPRMSPQIREAAVSHSVMTAPSSRKGLNR